jgi:hypothetical protein
MECACCSVLRSIWASDDAWVANASGSNIAGEDGVATVDLSLRTGIVIVANGQVDGFVGITTFSCELKDGCKYLFVSGVMGSRYL